MASQAPTQELGSEPAHVAAHHACFRFGGVAALGGVLVLFLGLQAFMPLRTAVQIGADEGFELAKVTSWLHGHKQYSEVWNDQPPLHTFLIKEVLQLAGHHVLMPRLLTVLFGAGMISALFGLVDRLSNRLVAVLAALLLIVSPGFIELSGSCMLEVPSLAFGLTGLWLLSVNPRQRSGKHRLFRVALAGFFFACALETKLLAAYLAPLALLILNFRPHDELQAGKLLPKALFAELLILAASLSIAMPLLDVIASRGTYLAHLGQSLRSHFGSLKSVEFGSPAEHPFDWMLLLRNWDTSVPAGVALVFALIHLSRRAGNRRWPWLIENAASVPRQLQLLLPLVWLVYSVALFSLHRPWWAYYYVHIAVPLCWCGAIGVALFFGRVAGFAGDGRTGVSLLTSSPTGLLGRASLSLLTSSPTIAGEKGKVSLLTSAATREKKGPSSVPMAVALAVFVLCAFAWAGGRVYFEIRDARALPKTFSTLVIDRIARLKPAPRFMYCAEPIYSFHTDVPLPPDLVVLPLKRFWAGEMTVERFKQDLESARPEVILLANDSRPVLFQDLLESGYRLTYVDNRHRLLVRADIVRQLQSRQGQR